MHQPYRMKFIPGVDTVFRISRELGAYGTYISGAGPSIVSIVDDIGAKNFQQHAIEYLQQKNVTGWRLEILRADSNGADVFLD